MQQNQKRNRNKHTLKQRNLKIIAIFQQLFEVSLCVFTLFALMLDKPKAFFFLHLPIFIRAAGPAVQGKMPRLPSTGSLPPIPPSQPRRETPACPGSSPGLHPEGHARKNLRLGIILSLLNGLLFSSGLLKLT